MLLAQGLAQRGQAEWKVTVATPTPARGYDDTALPFRVVRQLGWGKLFCLLREADIVHLAGPCLLPMLWGLIQGKRVHVGHHGYLPICPNGLLVYEPEGTVCPGHFMAQRYGKCLRCNAAGEGWRRSAMKLLLTFPRRWLAKCAADNLCITAHVNDRLKLPRASVLRHGVPVSRDPESPAPGPRRSASPTWGG